MEYFDKMQENIDELAKKIEKRIEELEIRVKDLLNRYNITPIAEQTDKNGTIYRIVKCEANAMYKYVKVYFQVVNQQEKQIIQLSNDFGIRSVAIIDGNKVEKPNILSGAKAISGKLILEKNVITNFELMYYMGDDKIHRTIRSLNLIESNSGSELLFTEIPITSID